MSITPTYLFNVSFALNSSISNPFEVIIPAVTKAGEFVVTSINNGSDDFGIEGVVVMLVIVGTVIVLALSTIVNCVVSVAVFPEVSFAVIVAEYVVSAATLLLNIASYLEVSELKLIVKKLLGAHVKLTLTEDIDGLDSDSMNVLFVVGSLMYAEIVMFVLFKYCGFAECILLGLIPSMFGVIASTTVALLALDFAMFRRPSIDSVTK